MTQKSFIIAFVLIILLIYSCDKDVSVTPPDMPPPDGVLFVNTFPDSFKIFLDGKYRIRITPDSIKWLETGNYLVTLKKDFFIDTTFSVNVNEGKTTQEFIDFSINPRFRGHLSVEANPADVQIFINDSIVAQQTPAAIRNLMPGIYKVTVKKTDYEDKILFVTITSSKTSKVNTALIDTTVWDYYNTSNSSIPTNSFTALVIDHNNKLWLGSRTGVYSFDGLEWLNFFPGSTVLTHQVITSIDIDGNNRKWIATAGGISVANNSTVFQNWPSKYNGFPTDSINSVFIYKEQPREIYYFATAKGIGKYEYDVEFGYLWSFESLPINDNYTAISRSEFGLLAGSSKNGIAVKLNQNWTYYNRLNANIPSNSITSMASSNEGVWIGHLPSAGVSGGLSLYDGSNFKSYSLHVPGPIINCIYIDSNNSKWIGTNLGVFFFNEFSNKILLDESATGLPIKDVTGISEDVYGNIWFSTRENGLFKLKQRPF